MRPVAPLLLALVSCTAARIEVGGGGVMALDEGDAGDQFAPGPGWEGGFELVALRDEGPSPYPFAPDSPNLGLSYGMHMARQYTTNTVGASTIDARLGQYTSSASLIGRPLPRHQLAAGLDVVWSAITFEDKVGWDQTIAWGGSASYLFFFTDERHGYARLRARLTRPDHTSGDYPLLPVTTSLGWSF